MKNGSPPSRGRQGLEGLLQKGFTLIELLISIALLAVILLFTIPFSSTLHQKNQINVIQNDIKSAIRYAKIQALTTGKNVLLTPLQGSNNWSGGMMLFNDNAKHRYTSNDKPIHEWSWHSPDIHVTWSGFQSNRYLLFSADASQNAINGTFVIYSNNSESAVKLIVNKLGRVRIEPRFG